VSFDFYLPVNLRFGRGRLAEIGAAAAKYGKKALLVTGGNSVRTSGTLDRACQSLADSGVGFVLFDRVTPNPTTDLIYEGRDTAAAENCDCVIGLGGGSAMDAAKAVAFAMKNDGPLFDYIYGGRVCTGALPVIAVPTTAGTGSEGNGVAVLTDTRTQTKKGLKSPHIIPKASIIDPELFTTMPARIIAYTVFDALCHNLEAFTANRASPMTDALSQHGLRLIAQNARRVFADPGDLDAWESIGAASTLGGMSIAMAGVTLAHGMEHPMSSLRNVAHGEGLAAVAPAVTEINCAFAEEKHAQAAQIFGGRKASDLPELLSRLLDDLGLKVRMRDLGIRPEDIDWMTQNVSEAMKANLSNNPKPVSISEVERIYQRCY